MSKKLKTLIVILSVMLAVSIIALVSVLLYRHFAPSMQTTTTVPNNLIGVVTTPAPDDTTVSPDETEGDEIPDGEEIGVGSLPDIHESETTAAEATSQIREKPAVALYLHNRNDSDNVPFEVMNMFPGDVETKYFCVRVAHSETVTVKYRAEVRKGYEILAEVLKCRITLLNTGEVLYDGLMKSMPKSLDHAVVPQDGVDSELYYEVMAYLETSVGNRHQNRRLIADFHWWVEGELEPPDTGDDMQPVIIICVMAGILLILVPLLIKRRKEREDDEQQ